jgi:hypothetical protein
MQNYAATFLYTGTSAPELQELIDAAERVCQEDFGKTSAMTLLKKKADATRTATCWGDQAFVSSAGCPAVSRFRMLLCAQQELKTRAQAPFAAVATAAD